LNEEWRNSISRRVPSGGVHAYGFIWKHIIYKLGSMKFTTQNDLY